MLAAETGLREHRPTRDWPPPRHPAVVALSALLGGCSLVAGSCTEQYRSATFAGVLQPASGDAAADTAAIFLDEFRGTAEHQQVNWRIGAAAVTDSVAAIHLHDTRDRAPLVSIPPRRVASYVALSSGAPSDNYAGTIPYDELFQRLVDGDVYVDVHLAGDPDGLWFRRAELRLRGGGTKWRPACSD